MNSRLTLPTASRPPRGPDWRRIYRFALLGTLIMLVWLLYPTVVCSWDAYSITPLDDDGRVDVTQTDQERLNRGQGFWDQLTDSVSYCYAETPLTGQGPWKTRALYLFAIVMVVSWILDRMIRARRHRQNRELG